MEAMTSEREAFERVFAEPPFEFSMAKHDQRSGWPGQYRNYAVQCAWDAWQARAHLAQPAQAVDVDYVPGELDRTAPERVWLQIDTSASNDVRNEVWPGADGVTWQDESIGGLEIQYVRADLVPRALSVQKAGPVGDGWQPIETAPKDGTSVLLAFGGKKPVGGWWNDDRYAKVPRPYWSTDNERIVGIPWLRSNPPIAWMPLPASPTPGKEGA